MAHADDLKGLIKGDVLTDEASRTAHATDASIFEVMPEVVVFPKDVEDIQKIVRYVGERKRAGDSIALAARSAGTDMSGGPLTESVVVGFLRYMNRIKSVTPERAVAEPGVYYRDLEKEMDKLGVMFPSYPASKGLCAIGGIVSNNSGGEKTLAYGKTERYVEEIKVVLSNGDTAVLKALSKDELEEKKKLGNFEGEIYRKMSELIEKNKDLIAQAKPKVNKNSAGYYLWNVHNEEKFDLTKLIVGSQGTLAVVTEATLRLVPKKKHSRLLVMFLKDLAPVGDITNTILKLGPESFESYDDHTLDVALKFLPDVVKVMMKSGTNIFSLGLQFLPEFWMVATGGKPKLVMLAEFTADDEAELERKMQEAHAAVKKFPIRTHVTHTKEEADKYWTMRRESFNLLRHRIHDRQTAPFIDDIVVLPEQLPEFLPRLNTILDQYKKEVIYTIAGHVGNGNFHIIPLMNLNDEGARKIIPKLSDEVYALVEEFRGSITAEHNDGLIRTPYLRVMYSEDVLRLFAETKNIFDPDGILNPGKKVGGNLEYAFSHIKRPK